MEIKTLYSLGDPEIETCTIGLARLAKQLTDYELFYQINCLNSCIFTRKKDLVISGTYFDHYFSVFSGYSEKSQSEFYFFSNKSVFSEQKKEIIELFSAENETAFLLPEMNDVDYLIKSSEKFPDFSVISLPEISMFQIQYYDLTSEDNLYNIIQYYE